MDDTIVGYVRDFSTQVRQYRTQKSEESLALLNRTASLITTTLQTQHFNAQQLEVAKFFVDLHAIMSSLPTDSYALWSCVALLQQCSRHALTRTAIVEQYRFVPMLTVIFERTQSQDKIQRLLFLLQELTFGIHITCEEPYVTVLLQQLQHVIEISVENKSDDAQAQLALSILINLCYKNFIVLILFMRQVNISLFTRQIKGFGMQASKLLIILSEDINAPDINELHMFLRSFFAAIGDNIEHWNVAQLRHDVEFLLDAKQHNGLHTAMLTYKHYSENIKQLLDQIEAATSKQNVNEQQKLCMEILLKFLRYILDLTAEHKIEVDINTIRIYELLCPWIECNICGIEAIKLIKALICFGGKKDSIIPRMSRDDILPQLITLIEKVETTPKHATVVLQLLLYLLEQCKLEKLILSRITESYFDKMFSPLLSTKTEHRICALNVLEIEKIIFVLALLVNFAEIAKKAYYEKCCHMMQLPQIQQALARAMLQGSEEVCGAIFQMSRFEFFPQHLVAQQMGYLNSSKNAMTTDSICGHDQWRHLNAIIKTQKALVGKQLEERITALLDIIETAHNRNQLGDVATSRMIELFNFERNRFYAAEECWQQRLEHNSLQLTQLTQRLNQQNAQIQEYQTLKFELLLKQESLQALCTDLNQQKTDLKRTMTDLMKKLSEKSESLQISEKRLTVSRSEMIVLQKNLNEVESELKIKREEHEKLYATVKEHTQRIENLKKTVAACDVDIKEKVRCLEEKDRELVRTQKLLEEQRDSKKRADDVIAALEKQLQEKNEQLLSCEQELSETEELRKTIMSLMESKKPKRKGT